MIASQYPEIFGVTPFAETLERYACELRRGETQTLQVNVGLLCNQACRHCHLEAGPNRREVMDRETMDAIAVYAARCRFQVIDITGGAPEMNPELEYLIERLAPLAERVMARSNLTALYELPPDRQKELFDCFFSHKVTLVASLPSTNAAQSDSLRGKGVWKKSVTMLKAFNSFGYGHKGTGLELDLVSNPVGAFLPASQCQAKKKFKQDLTRKEGIVFNNLFTFANVPLGRYRTWLEKSDNFEQYMRKLSDSFNPATLDGLMCRSQVSVSWDGYLSDCDFNLACGLYLGGEKQHVSEMKGLPEQGKQIMTGEHCYACTAGSGFT